MLCVQWREPHEADAGCSRVCVWSVSVQACVCACIHGCVQECMCTHLCVCVCVCVMGREGLVGVQASWQDLDTQNHEKQPLLLPVSPQASSAQPQAHRAQGSPLEFLFPSD